MRERQESRPERLEMSGVQMVAGALAAVSSSVALSRLGVAGTIAGAAVGSVLATAGTAVYGHYLTRTSSSIRAVTPSMLPLAGRRAAASLSVEQPAARITEQSTQRPTEQLPAVVLAESADPGSGAGDGSGSSGGRRWSLRWGALGLVSLAVFALAFTGISVLEVASGRSLSSWLNGGEKGSTTLGQIVRPAKDTASPAQQSPERPATVSPEPTTPAASATEPTPTATPTPTPTAPATTEPEPTVTPPAGTPTAVPPTTAAPANG
jgi:hypothetical protein